MKKLKIVNFCFNSLESILKHLLKHFSTFLSISEKKIFYGLKHRLKEYRIMVFSSSDLWVIHLLPVGTRNDYLTEKISLVIFFFFFSKILPLKYKYTFLLMKNFFIYKLITLSFLCNKLIIDLSLWLNQRWLREFLKPSGNF